MARVGCSPEHPKYTAGCADCVEIGRREKEATRRRKAAGNAREYVPVASIRPHVLALRAAGWRTLDIAREALVSSSTIDECFRETPRMERIEAGNARRILNIEVVPIGEVPPKAGYVDALVTRRKVQALACMGHSQKVQAAEAGLSWHQVMMIARGEIRHVKQSTHDAIGALYARWQTVPGERTTGAGAWTIRKEARGKGWHDPLAWDDINDPACTPDELDDAKRAPDDVDWVTVRHALVGTAEWDDLTHAERVLVVTELVRRLPDVGIGQQLGTTGTCICKFRERAGIPAATEAVVDRWQQEQRQRRAYTAPAGTVRRRYDHHEAGGVLVATSGDLAAAAVA